ncbi:stearoyl-CoA 9-desaturase, partial [Spiromyces aspiralis]
MTFVTIERPTYPKQKVPVDTRSLVQRLHWVHIVILSLTPTLLLYGLLTTPILSRTVFFTAVYYIFGGLGITAGYHRLWAHCGYSARYPLQVFLAIAGSAAVQGSIFWWSRDHRVHHRYTDTNKDPYNAKRGLIHSHIGWMLIKKDRRQLGYADTSDLKSDPLVRWQHKYYPFLALFMAIVVPTCICGLLLGDWRGGFFYASIGRI